VVLGQKKVKMAANEIAAAKASTGSERELVGLVADVARELRPGRPLPEPLSIDARLEEDLGFDSLGRMELFSRIERHFGVSFPERVLATAESARDLLPFLGATVVPGQEPTSGTPSLLELGQVTVPHSAATLPEVLEYHRRRHPGRTHILLYEDAEEPSVLTYSDLWHGAGRAASALRELGMEAGQTLAIMLPTGKDYLFSFFGALLAGVVPVPIYPPARPSQIEDHLRRHARILANAGTPVLVTVPEALRAARLLQAQVPDLRHIVTPEGFSGPAVEPGIASPRPDALAFLQYTSGSTGIPKGVELSHANLLANIRAMGRAVRAGPEDIFVSWLPLYHDMGLIGAWLGSLYHAIPLVLMSPLRFLARPDRWLRAIAHHRGTLSAAPNFAYELCLRRVSESALSDLDLSCWRIAFNGAEPVSPDTLRRFGERFGAHGLRPQALTPVYGLAECSVGLAFPPLDRGPLIDRVDRPALEKLGEARPVESEHPAVEVVACGRALPGHEIRVVDELRGDLPDRRVGQVEFRGPSATQGYHRNTEASRDLLRGDGWLSTGDLGYLADGELYITGRVKDIIIRAGRNLFPYDAEMAAGEISGVRKGCVAIFGVRGEDLGTERLVVMAETRTRAPAARRALQARIEEVVGDVLGMPPDEIVLAPPHTVLKTSSGKIRRVACRDLYLHGAIASGPRAVWLQLLRLRLAAVLPGLRRAGRRSGEYLYAAYVWLLFALFGVIAALVVFIPADSLRWLCLRGSARAMAALAGLRLDVTGAEHLPASGPCIVVANHASYVDSLVLVAALPRRFSFVAKAELRKAPVLGFLLEKVGCEFVERFDVRQGQEDADRLAGIAYRTPLVFFPEGTFLRAEGLLPFRMGAFVAAAQSKAPLVPVTLRGTRRVLRGGTWLPRRAGISVVIESPLHAEGPDWPAAVGLREHARGLILSHCGEPDAAG